MAIDKDKVFELFGRYWEIAYNEGRTGEGFHDLANDVLAELRDALDADGGDVFTGQLVEIDGHTYGLRPCAARIVREALASSDPELDGTDFAHPAWWRGHNNGSLGMIAAVTRILDGKDDGKGVANEPWQFVRTRLREALRDSERYRWLRYDGDGPANAIAAAVAEGDNEHGGEYVSWLYGDELDAAIDAEMATCTCSGIQAAHDHHAGCPAKDGA